MNPITLNYSERANSFMSFLSSRPKMYLDFKDRYYSLDSNNVLRLHNSNPSYNTLDSTTPVYSKMQFIVNSDYPYTKTFDNVVYSGNFIDVDNFSPINFETNSQISKDVDYVLQREDTYRFAVPRENSTSIFSGRMRGKYLISNYVFNSTDGNKFSLPYINTTYRYSMI